jgi:hypothetical protein
MHRYLSDVEALSGVIVDGDVLMTGLVDRESRLRLRLPVGADCQAT